MSKNFDETVRLQSEKRQEWMREIKRRLQGIERAREALPVWPAHQPRRFLREKSVRGPIVA